MYTRIKSALRRNEEHILHDYPNWFEEESKNEILTKSINKITHWKDFDQIEHEMHLDISTLVDRCAKLVSPLSLHKLVITATISSLIIVLRENDNEIVKLNSITLIFSFNFSSH
jgi:hypothetical protein